MSERKSSADRILDTPEEVDEIPAGVARRNEAAEKLAKHVEHMKANPDRKFKVAAGLTSTQRVQKTLGEHGVRHQVVSVGDSQERRYDIYAWYPAETPGVASESSEEATESEPEYAHHGRGRR